MILRRRLGDGKDIIARLLSRGRSWLGHFLRRDGEVVRLQVGGEELGDSMFIVGYRLYFTKGAVECQKWRFRDDAGEIFGK